MKSIRPHYSMRTNTSKAYLLNRYLCANLSHLVGDPLGLVLGDTFLDGLGGLINDSLSLFQAQAGQFAYNLDDVDFVGADLCEDGIELGLLLYGCGSSSLSRSCRRGSCSGGDRGSTDTPLLL